jgi:DNA-binding NtrC family response regulator
LSFDTAAKIKKEKTITMSVTSKTSQVLVVDDSPVMLKILGKKLADQNFNVCDAQDVETALDILRQKPIDIVITDKSMPAIDGLDLVRFVRENHSNTGVIMMTGHASVEGAVEAVKIGADEYLQKPITDDKLLPAVQRVLEKIERIKSQSQEANTSSTGLGGIIGHSPRMQRVFLSIKMAANSPATVLITGESGTGKELVARATHYNSPRKNGPFVSVNCSAIPETLLESELFGAVKGAYTGSTDTREGFFAKAENGSIFMDEISSTSAQMQSKLLRVLQEKEITKVGSNTIQKIDVKVIAATNQNLKDLVEEGRFREDLYYRLNVLPIDIPALSERDDDVLLLTHFFVQKFSKEYSKESPSFSDNALRVLKNYAWPGNVRELENLIQRLIVMTEETIIDVPELPPHMRYTLQTTNNATKSLLQVEQEHIKLVLENANSNKTRAAKILGIDRKTLREKLKKHEII